MTEASQTRERLRAIVSGRVQGVSFRWATREKALELGLSGWVKNLPDGNVEFVAEGDAESLRKLLDWSGKGPPAAQVLGVVSDWQPATGEFSDFVITR